MMRYGVTFTFREIFFTHYHRPHLLGSSGCSAPWAPIGGAERAKGLTRTDRRAPAASGSALAVGIERNKFPVEVNEPAPGDRIRRAEYDIVTFETEHRADTIGYGLVEHTRLGRFGTPTRPANRAFPRGRFGQDPQGGAGHPVWPGRHPSGNRRASPAPAGPWSFREIPGGSPRPGGAGGRPAGARGDLQPCDLARARETGHTTAVEAAELARDAGSGGWP